MTRKGPLKRTLPGWSPHRDPGGSRPIASCGPSCEDPRCEPAQVIDGSILRRRTQSSTSSSASRTCRPSLKYRIRRSAMSRRTKRGVTFSRSATSSMANSGPTAPCCGSVPADPFNACMVSLSFPRVATTCGAPHSTPGTSPGPRRNARSPTVTSRLLAISRRGFGTNLQLCLQFLRA